MKAAVITSFDRPPHYGDWPAPVARRPGDMLVDVLAVGLHRLTRGMASGRHHALSGDVKLPMVAGADGVGLGTDGKLRYFAQGPGDIGTMAGRTLIQVDHSVELPSGCDPIRIAGAMNPAMASWLALRCRVPFKRGQRVMVLGATGSSGRLAVQVARHLGAAQVIATGRDPERLAGLPALGATETVQLGDTRLGVLAREVDVVLDFLWGASAVDAMEALLRHRVERSAPLSWIHVGSMAGDAAAIPGGLLRAANLHILGSGHGSVSGRDIVSELPHLAAEITRGTFRIDVQAVPLHEVERVWSESVNSDRRIVFTP